jgi:hypothetical protein
MKRQILEDICIQEVIHRQNPDHRWRWNLHIIWSEFHETRYGRKKIWDYSTSVQVIP